MCEFIVINLRNRFVLIGHAVFSLVRHSRAVVRRTQIFRFLYFAFENKRLRVKVPAHRRSDGRDRAVDIAYERGKTFARIEFRNPLEKTVLDDKSGAPVRNRSYVTPLGQRREVDESHFDSQNGTVPLRFYYAGKRTAVRRKTAFKFFYNGNIFGITRHLAPRRKNLVINFSFLFIIRAPTAKNIYKYVKICTFYVF